MPRFVGQKVYWGPGFFDLVSGEYRLLENAQPAMWPGGGERAHVYAWSPTGDRLVGGFSTGNPNHPTRVTLFGGETGATVASLWEGNRLPPQAAWVGEHAVVVGLSSPEVFDHSGEHVATIALDGANVAAIDAPGNERWLMVLDLNRTISWIDTATWTILDVWSGPWLHAAVSPDGRLIVALEAWGNVHFARMENDKFSFVGSAEIDSNAVALALTDDQIATVGGGEVRWASLTVDSVASVHD
ncbi:MAG TPA: hypothetical protein VKH40_09680 [Alloacidobacterium sp.]|nr:hypothetical protein [Alloacidobacterium sp.]